MHLGDGQWSWMCAGYAVGALAAGAAIGRALGAGLTSKAARLSTTVGAAVMLTLTWLGLAEVLHHTLAALIADAEHWEWGTQLAAAVALALLCAAAPRRAFFRKGVTNGD